MSLIKDNLSAYSHLFKGILTVSRVMAFEKFTALFFFFYLLFVLSLGFILSVLHWGVGIAVLVLGLLLFTRALAGFGFLKRSLVRRGDRVEYADPQAAETSEIFKEAKVLLKMRIDEVRKSKLISEELMEEYQRFYLVEADKKPFVIPYEWIVSLSPEILDTEFEA